MGGEWPGPSLAGTSSSRSKENDWLLVNGTSMIPFLKECRIGSLDSEEAIYHFLARNGHY